MDTPGTPLPTLATVVCIRQAAALAAQAVVGSVDSPDHQRATDVLQHVFMQACNWLLVQLSASIQDIPEDDSMAVSAAVLRRVSELMDEMDSMSAQRAGQVQ